MQAAVLDLRKLMAFCKVYELRSFSRAGDELFVTQPTISAHVASLEKDLGVLLFDRLGRLILPTQAGELLYGRAQKAFSNLEAALAEIRMLQDKVSGSLTIGGSTIPANYLLPRVLSEFVRQHPDVTPRLEVGDSAAITEMVAAGKLLLGVVGAKDDQSSLAYTPLLEDELVVVAAPEAVASGAEVAFTDLFAMDWVMREPGSGTRRAIERGFAFLGRDVRELTMRVEVASTQAVLQCVKAGLGVSITSRIAAKSLIDRGELVEFRAAGLNLSRSFYCVFHEDRHVFPVLAHFIRFLKQRCAELYSKQTA